MSLATHVNPSDQQLAQLLGAPRTVAVVGLSPETRRDSHRVAAYLQAQGWRIIPVNPKADAILGEKSYPDLAAIPEKVDVVAVFRASEHVPPIAAQAVAIGASVLWLQLGIVNDQAARESAAAGLLVVQDRCIRQEHARLKARGK
jgi:hypothetical protein